MNDMESIIREDAQKRIAELVEMAQDAETQIKHLEAVKVFASKKIAEYGDVLVNLDKTSDMTQELHSVRWLNTDNLKTDNAASVEVHGVGCEVLHKFAKTSEVRAGLTEISKVEQWNSAQTFFDDYNADFYAEGGNIATWSIAFFPCTGLVNEYTMITEMSK